MTNPETTEATQGPVYAWLIESGKKPQALDWTPTGRDFLEEAKDLIGCSGVDMVSLAVDPALVMAVDEWGAMPDEETGQPKLELNPFAWYLYGRSPIFGKAVVWSDHRDDAFRPQFLQPIPPETILSMNEALFTGGYSLMVDPQGLVVTPEAILSQYASADPMESIDQVIAEALASTREAKAHLNHKPTDIIGEDFVAMTMGDAQEVLDRGARLIVARIAHMSPWVVLLDQVTCFFCQRHTLLSVARTAALSELAHAEDCAWMDAKVSHQIQDDLNNAELVSRDPLTAEELRKIAEMVAEEFPPGERRPELTTLHHAAVLSLPKKFRTDALQYAVDEGLDVEGLRSHVEDILSDYQVEGLDDLAKKVAGDSE